MEKEILKELISKGLSQQEISNELKCSKTNIRYWLKKYELTTNETIIRTLPSLDKKICTKCNKEKKCFEFYIQKGRKNGSSFCKTCFNESCIKRWQDRKIDAIKYKGGKCVDCNVSYPNYPPDVFHFHHLDPNEKDADWNQLRLTSWNKIKKELDKCVVLCANCHIIRHYNQYHNVIPGGIEPPLKV